MNIGSFLKLVEIQTKVASIIPYLLGTAFAIYKFENFNMKEAIILFLSMIVFDMTTTAINNYVDYTKAIKKEGFGYEEHNAIKRDNLNPKAVLGTILVMLAISITLGIILFINTDISVLIVGVVCFGIGILYSFGPIPISRTPFGEIFSGITMGFFITFLAIYVHIFDKDIITFSIISNNISVAVNINLFLSIVIVSMPAITGIANIMLANNICDMEEDIINRRYTLPIYIGKEISLKLFRSLYYIGFLSIIIGIILRILPLVSILSLITLKPVNDNINEFLKLQSKKDTFVLAVKNFIISNSIYIVTIILGVIILKFSGM